MALEGNLIEASAELAVVEICQIIVFAARLSVVIRKKENRPEAADHGRSKPRSQRWIGEQ